MDVLEEYARANQQMMEFYFNHHIDGHTANQSFQQLEQEQTKAIAAANMEHNVTTQNPGKSDEELLKIMVKEQENSIFYSSANQLGSSEREWTVKDAEDMANVNIESKELLTIYNTELQEVAESIYKKNGKKGKKAIDLAVAQATSQMEKTSTYTKLQGLKDKWRNILGRELTDINRAVPIIDVSTGKLVRKGDSDLSPEAQASVNAYDKTVQDLSTGIFTNNTVKDLLLTNQRMILGDMQALINQNMSEKEITLTREIMNISSSTLSEESKRCLQAAQVLKFIKLSTIILI